MPRWRLKTFFESIWRRGSFPSYASIIQGLDNAIIKRLRATAKTQENKTKEPKHRV